MSDLAKTQAQWNKLLGYEFGLLLSVGRVLRETRDRMRYERVQAHPLTDAVTLATYTDGFTLAGVVPNQNTAVGGLLYVRITGAGPYTVTLYKATGGGGGDAVAAGTAAAGATATLTASNSSGITGTWDVPAATTTTTDDTFVVYPVVDFRAWARSVFDGTSNRDASTFQVVVAALEAIEQNMEAALGTWRALVARWGAETGLSGVDFMGRSFPEGLIADTEKRGGSGEVTRVRSGFLPELKESMTDDTTAGEQDVVKRVAAGAAGTFSVANTGQGAVASHTPGEQCPAGRWRFYCVAGADTGNGGSERFDGTFKEDGTDRELAFSGLVVGQPFSGPNGFGPITLTHTHTKTGDGSNNYFTAASAAVVTGDRGDANTDNGTLHWSLVANGSNWDIEFYKSSNRTAGDLVSKATNIASAATFTATPKNGKNVTVAWQLGGTEGAATGTLLLNYFVTQNSDGVPDSFEVVTSVTGTPGLIQKTVAEEFGFPLNSDTSGSESISDGYMKASTFPPMAVDDN